MKNKKKNTVDRKKKEAAPPKKDLSPQKKKVFWIIALLFPFVLLFLLEAGLRVFNYGGNLDLFIEGPPGYEEYLRCNTEVARRYFYTQAGVPTPPLQLFRKIKSVNGYRIFVLGESSAAGFPYGNNASFPNILGRGLSKTFPEKNIEVINIAFSAVNSYTLLDLTDEILEQSPDAFLIYTGHNEFYGALGVGSVQSLGKWPWLINTYLRLQSFKVFLMLRDILGWIRTQLISTGESDPTATMMENIVAEQTIPVGSALYESGKEQFIYNLEAIIQKASAHNVKVILSELVSNLRDQPPFISVENEKKESAERFFKDAREYESKGEFGKARELYIKAKDYDALRFRASEDFNNIIRDLGEKYSLPVVPMLSYFEKNSPHGLIGNNLMLEHLHPNKEGYFLIARAFYETLQLNSLISSPWPGDFISEEKNKGITELDSVYADLVVKHLKGSWPFQPKGLPNRFAQNFKPQNFMEEFAFKILPDDNYNLEAAHMELGKYFESRGEFDKAFNEYNALITSIPHELDFYRMAVTVLLEKEDYNRALPLLEQSLNYRKNDFAYKWIGQIALMKEDYKNAVSYLEKADLSEPQVVFNLSRAYYLSNQWNKGEEYFIRLQNLDPKSRYYSYLVSLRSRKYLNMKADSLLRK